ncbi:uncharacterized protein ARMOST_21011 [Armillaria ostoyae]|uniref:DUF6535 domain-containing protein n=1 Tax=Armillaria ostoyae TaxID=47428 RepID=A0A284S910_ARMOS|nr:uncharacterized protein ARMOST_21011 [Armillaria ostoyae]
MAENGRNLLSPIEEPLPCRPGKKQTVLFALPPQSTSAPVPTVDSGGYALSQPFEEAGPTSSIWHAYLDKSLIYNTNMLGNQRGQVNILLIFAGLFSAIMSTFIAQSTGNLQPDYEKATALLLFD